MCDTLFGEKRKTMRKIAVLLLTALLLAAGCSGDNTDDGPVVARINDYVLSKKEFQKRLAEELRYYAETELTEEMKQEFLQQLIRKELLIQEAMKRHLERRDEFVRSIERYWETTLIRDILDMEGGRITEFTLVTNEEVQLRYGEMKKQDPSLTPLEECREDIRKIIMDEKMTRALERWIDELEESASIEINEDVLKSK